MQNGITLVTPTGDRPEAIARLRHHVSFQEIDEPMRWIIVDDGDTPIEMPAIKGVEVCLLRRTRKTGVSLVENLLHGLSAVKGGKIIFLEDDDWYGASYCETMANLLDDAPLVGLVEHRYYHVRTGGHHVFENRTHASLSQTSIRHDAIKFLLKYLEEGRTPFVDVPFWRSFSLAKRLVSSPGMSCGMKGMPGRAGYGVGHREGFYQKHDDAKFSVLKSWIGDDWVLYQGYRDAR
jgi:hypothetical protein